MKTKINVYTYKPFTFSARETDKKDENGNTIWESERVYADTSITVEGEENFRKSISNISLPSKPSTELLSTLGITVTEKEIEVDDPPVILSSDNLTDEDVYALGDAAYTKKEATASWLCTKLGL